MQTGIKVGKLEFPKLACLSAVICDNSVVCLHYHWRVKWVKNRVDPWTKHHIMTEPKKRRDGTTTPSWVTSWHIRVFQPYSRGGREFLADRSSLHVQYRVWEIRWWWGYGTVLGCTVEYMGMLLICYLITSWLWHIYPVWAKGSRLARDTEWVVSIRRRSV